MSAASRVSTSPGRGASRRRTAGSFSSGAVEVGDREQAGEVERPGQREDLGVLDVRARATSRSSTCGSIVSSTSRRTGGPKRRRISSRLQRLQQVLGVVLLDLEVLVAGHAERVVLQDLHAGEQLVEVRGDDVLERDEALRRRASTNRGQDRRHLDAGEVLVCRSRGCARRRRGSATARRCTGRGAPGRPPAASAPGRSARRNSWRSSCLLLVGQVVPADELDALVGQLPGRPRSWKQRGVPRHQLARSGQIRAPAPRAAAGRSRPRTATPVAMRRFRPATRTMKNSSRLLAKIARNRARSSSGTSRPRRAPGRAR